MLVLYTPIYKLIFSARKQDRLQTGFIAPTLKLICILSILFSFFFSLTRVGSYPNPLFTKSFKIEKEI
jgi:hypothetical protein